MKYNVLIASLLVALAGCDQRSQPSEVAPVQHSETNQPAAPVAAAQPCTKPSNDQVMPPGLTLSIPYHVRADIIHEDESGLCRRHVVLEYLDGNVETTLTALEQSLAADGFAARPKGKADDGRDIVSFLKAGHHNIVAVLDDSPGDTPSNPEAKGTITLQYVMGDTTVAPTSPSAN